MVERRAQMMNDFSTQDLKSAGDGKVSVIAKCLKNLLRVFIWDDGIFAFLKEGDNLGIEIIDALVGPY